MHGSKETIPVAFDEGGIASRQVEWGDMAIEYWTASTDVTVDEYFKGLPDDMCQCPHYGYLIKGQMIYRSGDKEEVFNAGDLYYVAPGHLPTFVAGSEGIEFSPKEALAKTMEVIARNAEKLAAGGVA